MTARLVRAVNQDGYALDSAIDNQVGIARMKDEISMVAKIRESIRHCIGQNDLLIVPRGPAAIDDVITRVSADSIGGSGRGTRFS